jgi:mRNA interferase MazF
VKRGSVIIMVAPGDLGKPRPAIVVQAEGFGENPLSIIVCPVSSDIVGTPHIRPIVEPSSKNGLRVRSQIMTDKLIALRTERIRQTIGTLEEEICEQLDRALLLVLGLAR